MPTHNSIKIAYIIDSLNIGGTENQLIKQIELLSEKGYMQYLFCLRPSKNIEELKPCCPIHVLNVYSLTSFQSIKKLFRFSKLLKELNVDLVQSFFIDSNIFGSIAGKISGVKKIISCRRDMGFWYTTKTLAAMRIVNFISDRILVNSNSIKKNVIEFERVSPSKIDVIYNGIDLSKFQAKIDQKKFRDEIGLPDNGLIVGIVANLNREVKRVDLFLKVASEVLKSKKNVTFIVVGGGYLEKSLRKISADLKIHDRVHFTGLQTDVTDYLNIFDLGVLTSESEGFSNSIIEYMAAGLPVICFDSGGNRELISDSENGFLVKFDDYREMASIIIELLNNENLLEIMSVANMKKSNSYSWNYVSLNLEKYYYSLINFR